MRGSPGPTGIVVPNITDATDITTATAPAVALRRNMSTPTAHLVPVTADGEPIGGRWYMAGGNYATGDSRIADYYAQIGLEPIYGATPVHDRTKG